MENYLQIFQHEEFGKVRTLLIDGEPYFAGKDVATALKYKDASRAVRDHVDEEDKKIVDLNRGVNRPPIADAVSGGWIKNEVMFINESGLYSLIFSSKLPKAKEFKHWVTSEVLPSIRKNGYYISPKVEKVVAVENTPPATYVILSDISNTAKQLEEMFKLKHHSALFKATVILEKRYGVDLSEVKKTIPAFEPKINYYSPTQLGEIIAKEKKIDKFSSHKVNKVLLKLGLQIKIGKVYVLTDAGKNYGKAFPYENNGHGGYQVKWKLEVMEFFK